MNKIQAIREIIRQTRKDFENYFRGTDSEEKAKKLIEIALNDTDEIKTFRNEIDSMIPDTEDDGSWECSYALNTGLILLNLIDYLKEPSEKLYDETVSVFFDTVDFKTQQYLEKDGIRHASEEQILNHDFYKGEKKWFDEMTAKYR